MSHFLEPRVLFIPVTPWYGHKVTCQNSIAGFEKPRLPPDIDAPMQHRSDDGNFEVEAEFHDNPGVDEPDMDIRIHTGPDYYETAIVSANIEDGSALRKVDAMLRVLGEAREEILRRQAGE